MNLRNLLSAALLCAGLAARADESEANKADLAKLQGKWTMVSGSRGGFTAPGQSDSSRVCESNQVTVIIGGKLLMKANFTIDAAKKPKTIDYFVSEGNASGKTLQGIYDFDGDTTRFCFAVSGQPRPTDFKTAQGDGRTASVWKREAK